MTLIDFKTQVAGGESEAMTFKETTGRRGISLILESCSKAHLNPPKIYEDHGFIYTVFTRPTAQEWKDRVGEDSSTTIDHGGEDNESNGSVKSSVKSSVKKLSSADKIVAYLRDNPTAPAHELSQILNLTVRAVEKKPKNPERIGAHSPHRSRQRWPLGGNPP